jgi:cell division septation protein DedD
VNHQGDTDHGAADAADTFMNDPTAQEDKKRKRFIPPQQKKSSSLAKEVAALQKKEEKKMNAAQERRDQIKERRSAPSEQQQDVAPTMMNSNPAVLEGGMHNSEKNDELLMQGRPEVWQPELDKSLLIVEEEEEK